MCGNDDVNEINQRRHIFVLFFLRHGDHNGGVHVSRLKKLHAKLFQAVHYKVKAPQ